ncbi:Allergen V5/Tpx-1-related [Macleaya cordata]|uniref:Allergen V5/Tpx-1-related n=1 Tax=Macleaya cordata TaxID=56857 RepID=A0A200Q9V3_MACCD|nr:Allergen V5/Tpx-1-related [Macleaya cordata]
MGPNFIDLRTCVLEPEKARLQIGSLTGGQGKQWSPTEAIAAWIAEQKWYNYENDSCTGEMCSHYTQIVWRTTERVGCAKIICDSGDSFIACEYFPPGNYIGVRPY